MKAQRYAIAKLEVEFRVLAEELIVLETNTRRMDLPHLLTVWLPEIISSKLYIQLKNIGEENARKRKKKKKNQKFPTGEGQGYDGEIQYGGMPNPSQGLDLGEGQGTYLSNIRQTIHDLLEDQTKVGGEDHEGQPETGEGQGG